MEEGEEEEEEEEGEDEEDDTPRPKGSFTNSSSCFLLQELLSEEEKARMTRRVLKPPSICLDLNTVCRTRHNTGVASLIASSLAGVALRGGEGEEDEEAVESTLHLP